MELSRVATVADLKKRACAHFHLPDDDTTRVKKDSYGTGKVLEDQSEDVESAFDSILTETIQLETMENGKWPEPASSYSSSYSSSSSRSSRFGYGAGSFAFSSNFAREAIFLGPTQKGKDALIACLTAQKDAFSSTVLPLSCSLPLLSPFTHLLCLLFFLSPDSRTAAQVPHVQQDLH